MVSNLKIKEMKEFALIFRSDAMPEVKLTPEGTMVISDQWQNWMGGISAQNKLVTRGNRLGNEGKTVKPNNVIINGPYAEIKEMLGGYTIIRADSIEEATEIAKGCPILAAGGNVEIRDTIAMNLNS
jgi:hypothetical protein